MDKTTESINSKQSNDIKPSQLVENMYNLQQRSGKPFDISTNEGRELKEAGWLDDRGYIDRDGFSKFFGSTGSNRQDNVTSRR
jgi:hypothetical protein